jgi:hypothetical protein
MDYGTTLDHGCREGILSDFQFYKEAIDIILYFLKRKKGYNYGKLI